MNGVTLIVYRRGWTGKVVNLIDFDIERVDYVLGDDVEHRLFQEPLDIAEVARGEIVEASHIVSASK